ncbi:ATP-binding protein [Streptomyces sp. NPDC126514]|uniref:ATP-binding protein n=1 Tax=Streptomyces sp. NPDC126514 TaxID=3155210 RepID=UPI0033347604
MTTRGVQTLHPGRPEDANAALEVCIERRPNPEADSLSQANAVWPQRLRRIVRASLTYWGRPDLIEAAELLLTELATNAFIHADGLSIGVRMHLQADHLKIEVNDGSPARPVPRCANPYDESGRGLFLVAHMVKEWGVSEDGTTTWCILP